MGPVRVLSRVAFAILGCGVSLALHSWIGVGTFLFLLVGTCLPLCTLDTEPDGGENVRANDWDSRVGVTQ